MQCNDRLPRPGGAGDAGGAVVGVFHQVALGRVQEDRPLLPRVVQRPLELYHVRHHAETTLRVGLLAALRGHRGRGRDDCPIPVLWGVVRLTPLLRDEGNVTGARRFHAQVGLVMIIHIGLATLVARAPRRGRHYVPPPSGDREAAICASVTGPWMSLISPMRPPKRLGAS